MALLQDRRCENCGFSTWYFSYEWSKCQFSPQAAPLLSSPLLILEQTASPFYNFDRLRSSINILPEVIRHPPAHRGFELGLGEIVTRYFIINLRLFPLLVRIGDDISNPSREVISILDQITTRNVHHSPHTLSLKFVFAAAFCVAGLFDDAWSSELLCTCML